MQVLLFPNMTWSPTLSLIFSIIIVFFGLAIYIAIFIVSPKLKIDMAKRHPEYKFV